MTRSKIFYCTSCSLEEATNGDGCIYQTLSEAKQDVAEDENIYECQVTAVHQKVTPTFQRKEV